MTDAAANWDPARSGRVDRTRLSVVLPTHNRKESLGRCLEGLFGCDVAGLHVDVHVVDDASTDDTAALVAELQERAPEGVRVRYHRLQPGHGAATARNTGISASDTDLVLCIDDDCVPERGWLRALAGVDWEGGIGAAGGQIVSPESGNWVSRYCRQTRFNEYPPAEGPRFFVNTANCAFLRSAIEALGGFERLFTGAGGEDHDLSWRIVLLGYRLDYCPEAVVRHYHRETLSAFARAHRQRGYGTTLLRALWQPQEKITWARWLREAGRLATRAAALLWVPVHAARLLRRGTPGRDALAFAFLQWLERTARRCGRLAFLGRWLTGRHCLNRTSHVPAGERPRSETPLWARR